MFSVIFWVKKKSNKRNEIETIKQAKKQSKNETISAGDVVSLSGENKEKTEKTVKMVLDLPDLRPQKAFVVVIFSFHQKSEGHL